jgi:hypothetical protein
MTDVEEIELKTIETLNHDSEVSIDLKMKKEKILDLMRKFRTFNLKEMYSANFFYRGKPTKKNISIFYLITSRIKESFFLDPKAFAVFIFKTIYKFIQEPFLIVIDMSWTELDEELIFKLVAQLKFIFSEETEMYQNLYACYILHPTLKQLNNIEEVLNLIPDHTKKQKIIKVSNWNDFESILDVSNIFIPYVSKKFVPMSFSIVKHSHTNNKRERLLKFTNESILNIDTIKGIVHNEIFYKNILEVR